METDSLEMESKREQDGDDRRHAGPRVYSTYEPQFIDLRVVRLMPSRTPPTAQQVLYVRDGAPSTFSDSLGHGPTTKTARHVITVPEAAKVHPSHVGVSASSTCVFFRVPTTVATL